MSKFDKFVLGLLVILNASGKDDKIRFIVQTIINEEGILEVIQCRSLQPYYSLVSNKSVEVEIYESDFTMTEEKVWVCNLTTNKEGIPKKVTDMIYRTKMNILNIGSEHKDLECKTLYSLYAPCITHINIIDSNVTDQGLSNTTTTIQVVAIPNKDKHDFVKDVEYDDGSTLIVYCICSSYDYFNTLRNLHCALLLKVTDTNENITIIKDWHNSRYDAEKIALQNLDYSYNNKIVSCYKRNTTSNETWETGIKLKHKIKLTEDTSSSMTITQIIVIIICVAMVFFLVTTSSYYAWTRCGAAMLLKRTTSHRNEEVNNAVQYSKKSTGDGSRPSSSTSHEYQQIYDIVYEDRHKREQMWKTLKNDNIADCATKILPPPPIETIPTTHPAPRSRLPIPESKGSLIPESDLYLLKIDSEGYEIPDELKFIPIKDLNKPNNTSVTE